jgi:hypothetical protein
MSKTKDADVNEVAARVYASSRPSTTGPFRTT